jgi:hypothetical protein
MISNPLVHILFWSVLISIVAWLEDRKFKKKNNNKYTVKENDL